MENIIRYTASVGDILIAANETHIIALRIGEQQKLAPTTYQNTMVKETKILHACCEWLDAYFAGERPDISYLPLAAGGTQFQQTVWQLLRQIPYGTVVTYGDVAQEVAKQMGKKRMSAQAIGGAVGHNPISLIIPCHRVVGADGSLTGYAGGLYLKKKLLQHEGITVDGLCLAEGSLHRISNNVGMIY